MRRPRGYFTEYPEDIKLIGLSFNTQLGTTGIALQGEVSYRQDVPLQFDDVELLFAALTPFEAALFPVCGTRLPPATCASRSLPTLTRCGQLGAYGLNQRHQGWDVFDVWQGQFTATKTFPPMLGAQQVVAVLEAGVTHVDGMPDKLTGGPTGRGLRFNGPGTSVSGNAPLASRHATPMWARLPRGRAAEPFRGCHVLGLPPRDPARLPAPIGAWNVLAARRLAARRDRHDAGPRRQLRRGALCHDPRRRCTATRRCWEVRREPTPSTAALAVTTRSRDRDFVAATVKYSF